LCGIDANGTVVPYEDVGSRLKEIIKSENEELVESFEEDEILSDDEIVPAVGADVDEIVESEEEKSD